MVNVQIGPPEVTTRDIPPALIRDVIVVVRSVETDSAELIAARADGGWLIQRTRRSGADLVVHSVRLIRFFRGDPRATIMSAGLAPIVFSWLAHRGAGQSRIDPHDVRSPSDLRARLAVLLADERLFTERIVVLDSTFRSAPKRP